MGKASTEDSWVAAGRMGQPLSGYVERGAMLCSVQWVRDTVQGEKLDDVFLLTEAT